MLIQHENMRTGAKTGKVVKDVFEEEHRDKLKAAKCYIKEVDDNTEEDAKNARTNETVESQPGNKEYKVTEEGKVDKHKTLSKYEKELPTILRVPAYLELLLLI